MSSDPSGRSSLVCKADRNRYLSYPPQCNDFLCIFFKNLFLFFILERGEGREKERERNTNCLCMSAFCMCPVKGLNLQPGHVPLCGNRTGGLSVCSYKLSHAGRGSFHPSFMLSWGNSHLVIMCYPYYILLDLIC